jgi:ankyrin repeat protein
MMYAIKRDSLDIAHLAIEYGADPRVVDCFRVLMAARSVRAATDIIELGVDVTSDSPFTHAFTISPSKKILGIARQCIKNRPECSDSIREQLNVALRWYCAQGKERWITPLLSAGADPAGEGPTLTELGRKREAYGWNAYFHAVRSGKLAVLKLLQPSKLAYDQLSELLYYASWRVNFRMIEYLVNLGASVNRNSGGEFSALVSCMSFLDHDEYRDEASALAQDHGMPMPWRSPQSRLAVRLLVERGAKLEANRRLFPQLQRILVGLPAEISHEILHLLIGFGACPDDLGCALLKTPALRRRDPRALEPLEQLLSLPLAQRQRRIRAFLRRQSQHTDGDS